MDQNVAVAAVLAFLGIPASLLASLAKQEGWPKQVNQLLAMVLAAVGGVIVVFVSGGFHGISTGVNYVAVISLLYTAMQAVYLGLKDSPLEQTLSSVSVVSNTAPEKVLPEPEKEAKKIAPQEPVPCRVPPEPLWKAVEYITKFPPPPEPPLPRREEIFLQENS